jgi:hypothetical protein
VQRYPGGRYAHLAEAIVHMKITGQDKERQSGRNADGVSAKALSGSQGVASSSHRPAGAAERFMAADLAELASWSERSHTYAADPVHAFGRGAQVPRSVHNKLLNDAKQYMESKLHAHGLKLSDVVTRATDKRLEINLNYIEMRDYVSREGLWVPSESDKLKDKLIARADAYMSHFLAENPTALAPLPGLKSKDSIGVMRELLQDAPGLVIGEAHRARSSKRVIINNIPALKAAGVTTLYLEHVCADSHGKALHEYMAAPKGSPMPARLKVYLDALTWGNSAPGQKRSEYGFKELVKAAKDGGLQVIPVDTAETYATSGGSENARTKVMNYYAAEKIRLTRPEGKWIAFVGSTHATTFEGVPGLAQLHGVRSLIVDDFGTKSRAEIKVNVKNYGDKLDPDVTLSYKV